MTTEHFPSRKVLAPRSDNNVEDIITEERNNENRQKWYINSDGTLVNVVTGFAVDIYSGYINVGQKVITYTKTGTPNQIFNWRMVIAS